MFAMTWLFYLPVYVCVHPFSKMSPIIYRWCQIFIFLGCGPVLALEAASLHPAQLLGITKSKGTLDYGSDADFIFLNDNLEVKATYIAGECVWTPDGVQKYDLL